MNNNLIGGVLLIIGTSIGGGMLALPIATAQLGFINTFLFLIICWAVMTASALLLLEANLWHPVNSNLITMAKTTLGHFGQIIAWISYLLLLYALLAAYVSGGGDFLQHFLKGFHIKLSSKISTGLFTFLLSIVVYKGIRSVDYVNRGLMFSKLAATGLLVLCIFPFVSIDYLLTPGKFLHLPGVIASITVIITSFGFAVIVPSLRSYFKNNALQLRQAILIGSFIPLVCYILWELVIMGVVPSQGPLSLTVMAYSGHSSSDLINALSQLLHKPLINFLAKTFTAICLATSFLGVALSLFDFLSDGFAINTSSLYSKQLDFQQGAAKVSNRSIYEIHEDYEPSGDRTENSSAKSINKLMIYALTFIPPLIIAYHYPNAFIKALSYAGVLCAILLIALPAMMVWSGRYIKKCASGYQVTGGKYLLTILLIASFFLIVLSLI